MNYTQFFQKVQNTTKDMDLFVKVEIKRGKMHAWAYSNTYMTGTVLDVDELLSLSDVDFKEMAAREDLKIMADKLTEWGISPSEIHRRLDECLQTFC